MIWNLIAWLVSRQPIADWLIKRSLRTPYTHIQSADGTETYMGRWWLLNPYASGTYEATWPWFPWSIRIHHIKRPDMDRDLHDHPWSARTIILHGWYVEERLFTERTLIRGQTSLIKHNHFHRIDRVSPGGVFTLFITGKKVNSWGFLVNGVKVPWREYVNSKEAA